MVTFDVEIFFMFTLYSCGFPFLLNCLIIYSSHFSVELFIFSNWPVIIVLVTASNLDCFVSYMPFKHLFRKWVLSFHFLMVHLDTKLFFSLNETKLISLLCNIKQTILKIINVSSTIPLTVLKFLFLFILSIYLSGNGIRVGRYV